MKTILFLHGFFASGNCVPANALREALKDEARVLTPDLPLHPNEALKLICEICQKEQPDVLVGNSCGSFYAQQTDYDAPMLLGNPFFMMTEFLIPRIGPHQYKPPRANGIQDFLIDEQLVKEFELRQREQFNRLHTEPVWGLFGDKDPIAHFEPMFRQHFQTVFHFPGAHTPTAEETTQYYVPLIKQLMYR